MRKANAAVVVLAMAGTVWAQGQGRQARGEAAASVGGKKVSIDYGRPALKGRALGELLKQLPDDRIWRAGENEVTTLTTAGDLQVGGKKVAAGTYSVYVHIPESGDWSLVLNKDLGIALKKIWSAAPPAMAERPWPRLDGYTEHVADQEVLRASMQPGSAATPVDVFTVTLAEAAGGAKLTMAWGDKSYSVDLKPAR